MYCGLTFQLIECIGLQTGNDCEGEGRNCHPLRKANYFPILAHLLLFNVCVVNIEMGNSQNSGYSGTLQSDRHSEGGQNVDTEVLKKTLKVGLICSCAEHTE